jgi:hypothetical protein
MNVERILALADIIEAQPHTSSSDESGFNMNAYSHHCGTPCCIAGWAAGNVAGLDEEDVFHVAAALLDLSSTLAVQLFIPPFDGARWGMITPAQAAITLRNLAATGIVDWSHVGAGQ